MVSNQKLDQFRNERYQENVAEFSSALSDIFALRLFTTECDNYIFKINTGETNKLIPLFAAMKCFWNRVRVIVFENPRNHIDVRMETSEKYIISLRRRLERGMPVKPNYSQIKEIENLYRDLLQVKQWVGAGFAIRKEKSLKERLENIT